GPGDGFFPGGKRSLSSGLLARREAEQRTRWNSMARGTGIPIKPLLDSLEGAVFLRRPLEVPAPMRRVQLRSDGPWSERVGPEQGDELVAAHRHVARPRRHRPGIFPRTPLQEVGVVAADAVDNLRDPEQRHWLRTASVK